MNILCVIVLYKCKLKESESFRDIYNELIQKRITLYVYDNSPDRDESVIAIEGIDLIYISDPTNPGLSCAYNHAWEYASQNGYKWLLLLDQDTIIPNGGFVDKLEEYKNKYPDAKLLIPYVYSTGGELMSPARFGFGKTRKMEDGMQLMGNYSCINSGMCINTKAFELCGMYNNNVQLDFSDHQFIERYKTKYSSFVVVDYCLEQNYSDEIHDNESAIKRFKLYCSNWKSFESNRAIMKIYMPYLIMKHTIALSLKYRSFTFLKILFSSI